MHSPCDEILRELILAGLTRAASEPPACANLRVGVSNGIIHLAGQADSLETRRIAEEIATAIPGVRGVVNRIQAPGAPDPARTINLDFHDKRGILHE